MATEPIRKTSADRSDNGRDDTSRLEAFSDGVIGVAITLLVLNIQVPHLSDYQGRSTLLLELLKQWPVYLSYLISFVNIGIVWGNHHRTFRLIVYSDHGLRMLNLFLLMTITLIPFTTALLAEYIRDPAGQRTAAVIFGASWLLLAIAYNLLWQYAVRRGLTDPALSPDWLRRASWQTATGLVFYTVTVILAFFSVGLSVAICLALAIYYLIPNAGLPGRPNPV